jgi:hypothetical protein
MHALFELQIWHFVSLASESCTAKVRWLNAIVDWDAAMIWPTSKYELFCTVLQLGRMHIKDSNRHCFSPEECVWRSMPVYACSLFITLSTRLNKYEDTRFEV